MFRKTIVAIIGNDGSGKTYQARRIFYKLKKEKKLVKLIHADHLFLKIPSFFSSNKYFSPNGQKSQSIKLFSIMQGNLLFSLFFPILAYLDFLAFYLMHVWFSLKNVIIFDRYFYDKLIKFYNLGICSKGIYYLLLKITPIPTLTLYLDLSADISFRRKRELTVPMLNQRRMFYKEIARDFNFITIDAKRGREEVFSKIMKKLKYVK